MDYTNLIGLETAVLIVAKRIYNKKFWKDAHGRYLSRELHTLWKDSPRFSLFRLFVKALA